MDLAKLQNTYKLLQTGTDQLYGMCIAQQQQVVTLKKEIEELTKETSVLTFTSTALEQLLATVSLESLEKVEKLITYGLRVSFPGQNLTFRIQVDQKRGSQYFEPKLIHNDVEAPILEAFGGGPAAVASFLLRILVCRRFNLAPVLLLDEVFSFVSQEYVGNVAKLLRELADQLGFTIILVSHQDKFTEYATRAYTAVETSQGTIFKPIQGI